MPVGIRHSLPAEGSLLAARPGNSAQKHLMTARLSTWSSLRVADAKSRASSRNEAEGT